VVDRWCAGIGCNGNLTIRCTSDFYLLDTHVLTEAIEVLQREKKASMFCGADGSKGVKFFAS
jgi:hypothetical protein